MDTYSELYTSCQQLAEDTSADFLAYLPTAIDLAQDRLYRLTDIDLSKESSGVATVNNVATVTKPTDHRVTHNIFMNVNGTNQRLICKTEDYLKDYWPSLTETDLPKYYGEKDNYTWLIAPTPNGVYTLNVEYEAMPLKLSTDQETNVLTEKFADLLLYASMSNVCEWMKDDERKGVWEEKLAEALASTNNEGTRQRHDDNTNANNPIGGRNTKVKNGV